MRPHPWHRTLLILLLAWTVPGCASRDSGYKISNDTVAFIEPGVTTRAEVVENLGPPLLDLPDARVSAYSWGRVRVSGSQPVVRDDRLEPRTMGYYSTTPSTWQESESRRWAYAIAWDENNRVMRTERIKVEGITTLERTVREWAASGR
jgi:hypothetical protein